MKYIGKLYGKIGKKTFDTGKTSQDWDDFENEIVKLRLLLYQVEVFMEQENMNDEYDGIWRDSDEEILSNVKANSLNP